MTNQDTTFIDEIFDSIVIYDVDDSYGKEYQAGYNSMAEAARIMREQLKQSVKDAVEKDKPLYTKQRIAKGICKYGHIGQYAKSSKGYNYCKQCHHEQDRCYYTKRKAQLRSTQ